jgi:hypothetical protein
MQLELPKAHAAGSAGKVSIPAGSAMKKRKDKLKTKRPAKNPRITPDLTKVQPVKGIPDESQVDETARALASKDRIALKKLLKLVADHLGSREAARLWLFTPFAGLSTTPLDAVQKGNVELLLKILKSQWGRSPIYT